jgi:phospholipid transport system substrate-binding protein
VVRILTCSFLASCGKALRPGRGVGLFRAATTFTEASTGAEKSVGHGGSPKGYRLRLAWSEAPTPKMTSVPRGRLKALSPFPVADSSETIPRPAWDSVWLRSNACMRTLFRPLFVLCLVLCGLFFYEPCHAGEPGERVHVMLDQVMSVQADPQLQGDGLRAKRRAAIKEIIGRNFDFDRMAEGALRSRWNTLDEKQRTQFKGLFRDLFQDSYTRLVLNFLKQEKILYTDEEVRQDGAMVKTVILRTQEQIPVDYFLAPAKQGWRVHDVKIDGVSIVENYQRSFARVIKRESYSALLEKMRLQQQAIAAESTP